MMRKNLGRHTKGYSKQWKWSVSWLPPRNGNYGYCESKQQFGGKQLDLMSHLYSIKKHVENKFSKEVC